MDGSSRNVLFLSLSQFGLAFSFNFVLVFLPFFIHGVSAYSPQETLVWIGLIMGCSSLVAALASPFWGSMASRFKPKALYMSGLLSHAVLILLMAFVSSLPLLLVIRTLQGVMGGISTIGLIMVSSSPSRKSLAGDIGFYQNALTMGQLLGPPAGSLAASVLGYKGAFIGASALVSLTLAFCFFFVVNVPYEPAQARDQGRRTPRKEILIAWGLSFTITIQLMFLPGILPNVFEGYGIGHEIALQWSGAVVMSYTAAAMVGTYLICRLASKTGTVKLIIILGGLGIALQSLLAACPTIATFVVTRVLQAFLIAAILPLTIFLFSSDLNGKVIGFLNAGRFAGNAIGPIIGTSVLAFSSLDSVYLVISGLSIPALGAFAFSFGSRRDRRRLRC